MSTTLTFDQMERNADRTLAVALWARHATGLAASIPWFGVLHTLLRHLLRSLAREGRLSSLSDSQALELAGRLRELHTQLMYLLDHWAMQKLKTKPFFSRLIESLEEDTEDLYDVIENLVLSSNKEFRTLLGDCINHLSSADNPEPVARL